MHLFTLFGLAMLQHQTTISCQNRFENYMPLPAKLLKQERPFYQVINLQNNFYQPDFLSDRK